MFTEKLQDKVINVERFLLIAYEESYLQVIQHQSTANSGSIITNSSDGKTVTIERERAQVECPEGAAVPKTFCLSSQRNSFSRYLLSYAMVPPFFISGPCSKTTSFQWRDQAVITQSLKPCRFTGTRTKNENSPAPSTFALSTAYRFLSTI